jgi:hypothetical protein
LQIRDQVALLFFGQANPDYFFLSFEKLFLVLFYLVGEATINFADCCILEAAFVLAIGRRKC